MLVWSHFGSLGSWRILGKTLEEVTRKLELQSHGFAVHKSIALYSIALYSDAQIWNDRI